MAATSVIYSAPALLPMPRSPPPELTRTENRLKYIVQNRGIRMSEFFKDYDPLRSGYITMSQFRRCLDQSLALPLSDEEFEELKHKYNCKGNDLISYNDFIENIQASFVAEQLDGRPKEQIERVLRTPATLTSTTLSPSNKERTDNLLHRCAAYYKSRGIFVKSCYEDFDRHNMGYVTLSQFHRNFPGPPEVSETEISLLAQRYYDPLVKLYNYYRFNDEVKSDWDRDGDQGTMRLQPPKSPKKGVSSIEEIIQRIRDTVYKYGIRTTEFFCDFDKLRSGFVTENQFVCGLSLSLAKRVSLTREEIGALTKHFSTSQGQVNYREFCHLMENAYNMSDFEKKPTETVYRPLRGHLHKPINTLSPDDEVKMDALLDRLREEVRKRRLLLYPYFRDFDRKKGYTRGVTRAQFERLFQFLSLSVSQYEVKLIQAKFGDPLNGDINYSALIQAIDEEYIGQLVEEEKEELSKLALSSVTTGSTASPVSVNDLLSRIRALVFTRRVRVCEHFQDFDPLRSGYISIPRFRQGLGAIGLVSLSTAQFNALCDKYSVNRRNTGPVIAWKEFVKDIDEVFKVSPSTCRSAVPQSVPLLTADDFMASATDHQRAVMDSLLNRLKDQIAQRRLLTKPCFQDFDRHNSGHVTRSNCRQCLSSLDLPVSDEEFALLQLRFGEEKGFNYLKLLDTIQPQTPEEDKYDERIATIKSDRQKAEEKQVTFDKTVNVLEVMYRIKTKVVKERIRVLEFMRDYDKLRSGHILATLFHRALDLCGFGLTPSEVHALENEYRSRKDVLYVDYVQFSDDVESAFTVKELEKMPTLEVEPFVPIESVDLNRLSSSDEIAVDRALHKLAETVRARRMSLYPPFEDYDRVHRGNVSSEQFHRVLDDLGLSRHLSKMELNLICRKFGVQMGGRRDINYNSFCFVLEEYASSESAAAAAQNKYLPTAEAATEV